MTYRVRSVIGAVSLSLLASCNTSQNENQTDAVLDIASQALTGAQLGELLPTGARITPTRAQGASVQALNPSLLDWPGFTVDHPMTTALSPVGRTLLILTTGYNKLDDSTGNYSPAASNEYVFVYDVSSATPVKSQVLQVPNTFTGIAWNPSGTEFYVSGGMDDNLHIFDVAGGTWSEVAAVALNHAAGNGLAVGPMAGGLAVNHSGTRAVVANYENDSISLIDLTSRKLITELDLRPGKLDPSQAGVPGGEFPAWVAISGDATAYVSSQRDNEVVVVGLASDTPTVVGRIAVGGQPNRLLLSRDASRLFVANANDDSVSVVNTASRQVIEAIATVAPEQLFENASKLRGASPNSLALAPDERTLYVTNGGTNSVAVVALGHAQRGVHGQASRVVGLIPTGWYPNSVTVSRDGRQLFIVNGKSNAGPDPLACRNTLSTSDAAEAPCNSANQYVWQTEKGSFLTLPVPNDRDLADLSAQVATNNHFPGFEIPGTGPSAHEREVMRQVAKRIKHVIYIIKENRTYDQVLGDLSQGDGDPSLTLFPQPLTPNHHALASQFVTLDHFEDSGETSGVGWNWSMAGRTTDSIEKNQPPNYADRGLTYDWEGTNRNINVGLATLTARLTADPYSPNDPDILPGTSDDASHVTSDNSATAYLWDAALNRGLSVRNYGCFGDLVRSSIPSNYPGYIPLDRSPAASGTVQFYPAKAALLPISDPYFRGFDQNYPDYYRYKEWEREFDGYVASSNLPNLEFVRLPHDHFGSFTTAIDGVSTPDTQMADNDYAVGLLIDKVSHSPYAQDTVVFVIEDDAQDGPDHIDAHRSVALVAGPYVKRNAVVSNFHNTVDLVRTIEELLDLDPMGLTDGLAQPMSDLFEFTPAAARWSYDAQVPAVLRTTALPIPAPTSATASNTPRNNNRDYARPRHSPQYWQRVMQGQNFAIEDALDTDSFNRALWRGLMGQRPYPTPVAQASREVDGQVL